jgi:hypothetical protein
MTVEMIRPALVDDELLTLDLEYLRVYGPDLSKWSAGVRGEYLDLSAARSQRLMYREHLPQHPRRCSAKRRHRHLRQLRYRISLLVPGAATILLTPVWTDTSGDMEIVFMALVRDRNGLPMKLPTGGSQRLAALLQGAFVADWSRSQTWRADTNALREYVPPTPAYLASLASKVTESFADWEARQEREALPADWAERIRWAAVVTHLLIAAHVTGLEARVTAAKAGTP